MTNQRLVSAQNLIRQNPSLIWHTKSYDQLPIESIAEAIFNYGTWQEFLRLKEERNDLKVMKYKKNQELISNKATLSINYIKSINFANNDYELAFGNHALEYMRINRLGNENIRKYYSDNLMP